MKKLMGFEVVQDTAIADGTSLQGYIIITYDELVEKLGAPGPGDGYKTQAEWVLVDYETGVVATIYDWKVSKQYNFDGEGVRKEDNTDWHIGAKDFKTIKYVYALLDKVLGA
jgi:hypothetical protein